MALGAMFRARMHGDGSLGRWIKAGGHACVLRSIPGQQFYLVSGELHQWTWVPGKKIPANHSKGDFPPNRIHPDAVMIGRKL